MPKLVVTIKLSHDVDEAHIAHLLAAYVNEGNKDVPGGDWSWYDGDPSQTVSAEVQ